jgi:hypothetical protein
VNERDAVYSRNIWLLYLLKLEECNLISDFGAFVPSMCNVIHCSFFLFLYLTLHVSAQPAIFRCTGCCVQAAHSNALFFPSVIVDSGYFGFMGYYQFYLGVLGFARGSFGFAGFVGCGCLECSC